MTRTKQGTPKEIVDDLRRLSREYPPAMEEALWDEITFGVMNPSKEICPVDTSHLRSTGKVEDAISIFGRVMITFGYGTDYGIYVHENLTAYHKPPTKAKFLEGPYKKHLASGSILRNVLARVNEIVGVT